ncbi:MAG: hypothetical protein GY757_53730 [bacterium]|nr:hypothetical protein [bacterium]
MKAKYLRFMAILFVLLFLLLTVAAQAGDVDATFAWEQTDYAEVNYWILYWGSAAGGPYDTGQQQITKTLLQESQTVPVVIPYPPDAKTTYYFVLVAFKTVAAGDLFSANSNEVSLEVDFILPQQPLQLRVTITPGS